MPDIELAERSPLARCVVPGRHGRMDGEAGVTLAVRTDLNLHRLLARRGGTDEIRHLAAECGLSLPEPGTFAAGGGFAVLWAAPEQWLVVAEPRGRAEAGRTIAACLECGAAVEQTDAYAVIMVAGLQARGALAKGFPVDLHPRVFRPGSTAVTTAAAVAAQIWQLDGEPTFLVATPRSSAEGFWHWMMDASAEFGVTVAE